MMNKRRLRISVLWAGCLAASTACNMLPAFAAHVSADLTLVGLEDTSGTVCCTDEWGNEYSLDEEAQTARLTKLHVKNLVSFTLTELEVRHNGITYPVTEIGASRGGVLISVLDEIPSGPAVLDISPAINNDHPHPTCNVTIWENALIGFPGKSVIRLGDPATCSYVWGYNPATGETGNSVVGDEFEGKITSADPDAVQGIDHRKVIENPEFVDEYMRVNIDEPCTLKLKPGTFLDDTYAATTWGYAARDTSTYANTSVSYQFVFDSVDEKGNGIFKMHIVDDDHKNLPEDRPAEAFENVGWYNVTMLHGTTWSMSSASIYAQDPSAGDIRDSAVASKVGGTRERPIVKDRCSDQYILDPTTKTAQLIELADYNSMQRTEFRVIYQGEEYKVTDIGSAEEGIYQSVLSDELKNIDGRITLYLSPSQKLPRQETNRPVPDWPIRIWPNALSGIKNCKSVLIDASVVWGYDPATQTAGSSVVGKDFPGHIVTTAPSAIQGPDQTCAMPSPVIVQCPETVESEKQFRITLKAGTFLTEDITIQVLPAKRVTGKGTEIPLVFEKMDEHGNGIFKSMYSKKQPDGSYKLEDAGLPGIAEYKIWVLPASNEADSTRVIRTTKKTEPSQPSGGSSSAGGSHSGSQGSTPAVPDKPQNQPQDQPQTGTKSGLSLLPGQTTYTNEDGSLAKECWKTINHKTYYFNGDGIAATSWFQNNGNWYFGDTYGSISISQWQEIQNRWYKFDENGRMLDNQWVQENGNWYYLGYNGAMASNSWKKIKGDWYHFDSTGRMQTGWLKLPVNGKRTWYYLDKAGKMKNGWLMLEWQGHTDWYYFAADGSMLSDTSVGKYHLDSAGICLNPHD